MFQLGYNVCSQKDNINTKASPRSARRTLHKTMSASDNGFESLKTLIEYKNSLNNQTSVDYCAYQILYLYDVMLFYVNHLQLIQAFTIIIIVNWNVCGMCLSRLHAL